MDAIRIDLRAYTASFRIPGMMGYQATAMVPPPATVYGIVAAANGREVSPAETWIAYRFSYEARCQDLEKIIAFREGGPYWDRKLNAVNTVPIIREFLYEPHLVLYLKPGKCSEAFLRPRYPLLLGRSQDVAYVERFEPTQLDRVVVAHVRGVLVPFPIHGVRSRILGLPTYLDMATRKPLAVKPFHVLDPADPPQKAPDANLFYRDRNDQTGLAVPVLDERILMP
ncbi:MAG: CRISPR-associated protein Cas5 [Chthonomonadales bacterium]